MDGLEPRGEGLVLPDLAVALDELTEREEPRRPTEAVVTEIVLECPVIIEFIGEDISTAATEAVTTALLDGLAGVVRDA
ncbi:hypothetical protein [Kribbella sp. NBC_00359]|uniref:hypothetical protein n=1 Tax=Kribbella sp. NBC_00359 TaxID=2975966 RepID=UPI002E1FD816